ncbi:MAG: AAA family ATPase, partial [Planctomycetes bacterium]|nr:AAA family ATPase [Planctomycetota bacterium]
NTIVIMTSNLGSHLLLEHDPDQEGVREKVMARLQEHFRPEFLNRIDEIVLFHRLDPSQIRRIIDIQLEGLKKRLLERDITLELSDNAIGALALEGYDPAFGARPLKRLIQRKVENELAKQLLDGEIGDGDTVRVDVENGEFVAHRAQPVSQ